MPLRYGSHNQEPIIIVSIQLRDRAESVYPPLRAPPARTSNVVRRALRQQLREALGTVERLQAEVGVLRTENAAPHTENDLLRLLDDTAVPFTNNVSERSLRMVKLNHKISGPLHSLAGAEAFAPGRCHLQTASQALREPARCPAPALHHRTLVAS